MLTTTCSLRQRHHILVVFNNNLVHATLSWTSWSDHWLIHSIQSIDNIFVIFIFFKCLNDISWNESWTTLGYHCMVHSIQSINNLIIIFYECLVCICLVIRLWIHWG